MPAAYWWLAASAPRAAATDKAKREYLAQEMLVALQDNHSLGYYRRVAREVPAHKIFEALGLVKKIAREGNVRKNRGALFVSTIKRARPPGSV